ncbi:uncharacterized protein LOC107273877 [Cephus cinctus]|uniref:Uncharacterized protein LOC107273877 n=1 Tax=Cephus cinctus TaxID=211228 RepID=A0AAJ7CDN7_CEPCN|nr:uncharacterized protein LOC107273877 [Cephus cinctus]
MDPLQSPNKKRGVKTNRLTLTPTRIRNGIRDAAATDGNRPANRTSFLLPSNNRQTGLRNRITPRISLQPSATVLQDIPQQPETDNSNIELSLLYDTYLRAECSEIVLKKKVKELSTDLTNQLVKICVERDLVLQNLTKMRLRANDVKSLAYLQNNLDLQVEDADVCCAEIAHMSKLEMKLNKLKSLIEPLDSLCCKGIIIPKDSAGIEEILKTLTEINCALNEIKKAIGSAGESQCNFMATLDKFVGEYKEVKNIQANFENALGKLQALVLKGTSLCLR